MMASKANLTKCRCAFITPPSIITNIVVIVTFHEDIALPCKKKDPILLGIERKQIYRVTREADRGLVFKVQRVQSSSVGIADLALHKIAGRIH